MKQYVVAKKCVIAATVGLLGVGVAHADDLGVSVKGGTLGFGVDVSKSFSDSLGARIGLNGYNYSTTKAESGVDYDFKLKLGSVSLLADWYPFQGTFRTSAGLFYNNNKASLNAKPSSGTYTINNVSYTAAEVGSLNGEMTFNKAAPYIGIGWGNPVAKEKTWGFVADIGVLFQGSPKFALDVTCGAAVDAATCTQLKADAAAERTQAESDLKSFSWYPVVSIGVSYKF
jgi:hypothetical protein